MRGFPWNHSAVAETDVAQGKVQTAQVFRTAPGPGVTVEHKRSLAPALIRAALVDAVAAMDAETGADR